MSPYGPWLELALAAAMGLLVGLERERASQGQSFAGIRTFTLFATTGALVGLLTPALGTWLVAASTLAVAALVTAGYVVTARDEKERGATSEIAALIVFFIGLLATTPIASLQGFRHAFVVALGIGVTGLLSVKPRLHAFANRLSREDLLATLQFILAAAVVLPLVPDRAMGPLDAFNPYHVVLMVVLIAGIGFLGYIASRLLGPGRGLGVTGIVGGLVSSTAITLAMSGRARREPALARVCALSVILACTVMLARILATVAVVNPDLVWLLISPVAAMLAVGVLWALILWRRGRTEKLATADIPLKNPFQLQQAAIFGLVFAAVLFISKLANHYAGDAGLYLAGLVAGAADVDAVVLSMASLSGDTVDPKVAATVILIGTGSNTIVKAALATSLGGLAYGARVAACLLAMLAAGGLALLPAWL
ncbi:MAG: MgtC/SapB family protein [Myxococcota bacterium]